MGCSRQLPWNLAGIRRRVLVVRKIVLVVLLVAVSFTCRSFATSDEGARGTYSYKGDGLSVRFTWKLDGIHDLRLNGKRYSDVLPIDSLGRHGLTGIYEIAVSSDKERAITIQLFILFDETEGVRQASAFYIESATAKADQRGDWILRKSAQMQLHFTPLPPDKRG